MHVIDNFLLFDLEFKNHRNQKVELNEMHN